MIARKKPISFKQLKRKPSKQPHIVVQSAPYSATTGICKYLQSCNRRVGHEEVLEHGISSWYHTHFTRRDFIEEGFDEDVTILHQVRHPLMVISTLMAMTRLKWQKMNMILAPRELPNMKPDKPVENGMIFWYCWNKMADEHADYTYKIETLRSEWKSFLCAVKAHDRIFPHHSTTINRHGVQKIFSWNDLYKVNPSLTMDILELSDKYGYSQVPYSYQRDKYYNFPKQIFLTLAESQYT